MILAVLTVFFLASGGCALVVIDNALKAEADRFPCAEPWVRLIIRAYALFLAVRGAMLTAAIRHGDVSWASFEMAGTSLAMAATHGSFMYMLLRARLPLGVWPRLQRRLEFVKSVAHHTRAPRAAELAAEGAPASEILKADGATAVPPGAGPEALLSARNHG